MQWKAWTNRPDHFGFGDAWSSHFKYFVIALSFLGCLPRLQSAETALLLNQHDILPIVWRHCSACHGPRQQEAELNLTSVQGMLRGGKSGPAVVAREPDQSRLVQRIREGQCPPSKRLVEANVKPVEAAALKKLVDWIAQGAPEAPPEPDLAGTAQDRLVKAEDRSFWSFASPKAVSIPKPEATHLVQNPIDAFLLAGLEAKGLSFAPEASRQALARRLTYGLTGLPPTPAEMDEFLHDKDPRAIPKLIDRLLSSPKYGERLGRLWLDLAGYADVEGRREQHLPRPNAFRYRDYVIRAFNEDKAYDRFLQEQIAGDELMDAERAPRITREIYDNLVATGFLRMGPDPTWANITGFVPDRLEVISDAMDVLGSGVLGLTLKCARCHNHKFDPIPQRDYFRFVDLFKGVYDEYDWLKPGLQSFGGAANTGKLGERSLPFVMTEERESWLAHQKQIQTQIDELNNAKNPDKARLEALNKQKRAEPKVAALWDRGTPSPTYIYKRGEYERTGALVHPGIPSVLAREQEPFQIDPPWPGANKTGRRLALAKWLTRPDHPLTSRVMVNRIWKYHFGEGLVSSTGNFGKTGSAPSHPELLDWLAGEFVRNGWSVKELHRMILSSRAYAQASSVNAEHLRADRDNRLLSRMPLKRVEAEVLWDSLVYVAGALDEARFGPAIPLQARPGGLVIPRKQGQGWRRSIYSEQVRKDGPSLIEAFDSPQLNPNCLERPESVVATQPLHLMNDETVREIARLFGQRVRQEAGPNPARQVHRAFRLALSRAPAESELRESVALIEQLSALKAATGEQALSTFCHALLNSAEFLYID